MLTAKDLGTTICSRQQQWRGKLERNFQRFLIKGWQAKNSLL